MAMTDFEVTLSLADIQELTVLSLLIGTLCRGLARSCCACKLLKKGTLTHLQRGYERNSSYQVSV